MKIAGSLPLAQPPRPSVDAPGGARAAGDAAPRAAEAEVSVDGGFRFIAELRTAAARVEAVRLDEVARARNDLATGSLLSDEELDRAVDVLLAGL
jgi:hypothetical protein